MLAQNLRKHQRGTCTNALLPCPFNCGLSVRPSALCKHLQNSDLLTAHLENHDGKLPGVLVDNNVLTDEEIKLLLSAPLEPAFAEPLGNLCFMRQDFSSALCCYQQMDNSDGRKDLLCGNMYREGLGVGCDRRKAAVLFRAALHKGVKEAALPLADLQPEKAKEVLLLALPHPKAKTKLAKLLLRQEKPAEALELIRSGATSGDPEAITMLGQHVLRQKRYALAIELFEKASEQNHPAAQYLAAVHTLARSTRGTFPSPTTKQALHYLRKSANQGFPQALYFLATLHDARPLDPEFMEPYRIKGDTLRKAHRKGGKYVQNSDKQALRLYLQAAGAPTNHPKALRRLARAYERGGLGLPRCLRTAFALYQDAADTGQPAALGDLAFCYRLGWGTEKNPTKELRLLQKAAREGDTVSQYHLGCAFLDARICALDISRGKHWLTKAMENGDEDARECLATLKV